MEQTKSSVVRGCLLGFLTSRPFLLIFQRPGCRACVPYLCPVTPHVLHFSL